MHAARDRLLLAGDSFHQPPDMDHPCAIALGLLGYLDGAPPSVKDGNTPLCPGVKIKQCRPPLLEYNVISRGMRLLIREPYCGATPGSVRLQAR